MCVLEDKDYGRELFSCMVDVVSERNERKSLTQGTKIDQYCIR